MRSKELIEAMVFYKYDDGLHNMIDQTLSTFYSKILTCPSESYFLSRKILDA